MYGAPQAQSCFNHEGVSFVRGSGGCPGQICELLAR
jgi:hypothetical protein